MTLLSYAFVALVASGAALPSPQTRLETTIGMDGIYFLRYSGAPLEAKPLDENAPIILRIGDVTPVDAKDPTGPHIYELRYIGTRAGQYDLRDYLIVTAGRSPAGVEPIPVSVSELLPPDHQGDLEALAARKSPRFLSYRALLAAAAIIWSMPMLVYVANRLRRRRTPATETAATSESLEVQLQALATSAMQRELSPAERARLERLLVQYWRESLELDKLSPERLQAELSQNVRTSDLVRQLEAWLYRRPGTATVDVASLLEPYCSLEPAPTTRDAS